MRPVITVIIPTYNRWQSLKELLCSLQTQSLAAGQFEIIVINDGSSDETEQGILHMQQQMKNLRYCYQSNQGPAAARNRGARQAQGKYLAFTDDDCIATPDWLQSILDIFEGEELLGIEGRTSSEREKITPLTHQIVNEGGNPAVPTCNAAFRREAFLQAGGFDEQFPFAHNEDADLAWRLEKFGPIAYREQVHIIHPPRPEAFGKLMKRMKILESEFLLYYKDPERYKSKRQPSPWLTIYWEVAFVHQLRILKSHFRYLLRPRLFFSGLALSIVWWLDLARLLPVYWRAQRRYRQLFQQ